MRKQKATVWCDRAQHEDPRLLAQQRAAKHRANMEVVGGSHGSSARTTQASSGGIAGGVRSKIRHHGAVKASAYTGGPTLPGVSVPMRLSASEVDEHDDEDADVRYHQRNGSNRSSLGSGNRHMSYNTTSSAHAQSGLQTSHQPAANRHSNASTPPSAASYSPADDSPADPGETPMQDSYSQGEYFDMGNATGQGSRSAGSGSSEERGFGDVGGLPRRQGGYEQQTQKTSDDLRRRGSVDDRTMTMSGVRLFVANPDLSD